MTVKNVKIIFIFILSALFFSGCVKNVDLREPASTRGEQAREEKAQEQNVSSPGRAVDLVDKVGEPVTEIQKPIRLLFVGDMMFDRHIREAVEKYGKGDYNYILEPIKESLSQYDLVVGNLEGPIIENESVSVATKMDERNNFIFTFDPNVAQVLAENNIKLVNLGNNHILNQGAKGLEQTKKYLDEASMEYFGNDKFLVREIGGIRVGFVNYDYSNNNSEEKVVENIKTAKEQSDVVIVCPHWGVEYKTGDPGASIRALARRFIDAGADAIIGTHPHVIQTSEEYQGKKIYYSLGNFIFDQYFSRKTMEGLGVEVIINPDLSLGYNEVNFVMTKKGQTVLGQ